MHRSIIDSACADVGAATKGSPKLAAALPPSVPSYARVASSGSVSSPAPAAPVQSATLKALLETNELVRLHSQLLDDATAWAAVYTSCLRHVEAALARYSTSAALTVGSSATIASPGGSVACACASAEATGDPHRCGDAVYWYQSACGEAAFLDPLTLRALLEANGQSHTSLPLTLDIAVLQIDCGPLTDAVRSRVPFLHHLPVRIDASH